MLKKIIRLFCASVVCVCAAFVIRFILPDENHSAQTHSQIKQKTFAEKEMVPERFVISTEQTTEDTTQGSSYLDDAIYLLSSEDTVSVDAILEALKKNDSWGD